MKSAISSLPAGAKAAVARMGGKVMSVMTMKDGFPGFRDDPEAARQFGEVEGLYDPNTKTMYIPEFYGDGKTKVNKGGYTGTDVEGVVRHEFGHMVDEAFGHVSRTPEFKAAYQKDKAKMWFWTRAANAYLLQEGETGPSEAFAEVFASMSGGTSLAERNLHKTFPECARIIQRYVR